MLSKKKVIDSIKNLPDSFSQEELIDRIILLEKIQIGIDQAKAGKTYSLKEVEEKLKKWLK